LIEGEEVLSGEDHSIGGFIGEVMRSGGQQFHKKFMGSSEAVA
jgi:hypothetical protein